MRALYFKSRTRETDYAWYIADEDAVRRLNEPSSWPVAYTGGGDFRPFADTPSRGLRGRTVEDAASTLLYRRYDGDDLVHGVFAGPFDVGQADHVSRPIRSWLLVELDGAGAAARLFAGLLSGTAGEEPEESGLAQYFALQQRVIEQPAAVSSGLTASMREAIRRLQAEPADGPGPPELPDEFLGPDRLLAGSSRQRLRQLADYAVYRYPRQAPALVPPGEVVVDLVSVQPLAHLPDGELIDDVLDAFPEAHRIVAGADDRGWCPLPEPSAATETIAPDFLLALLTWLRNRLRDVVQWMHDSAPDADEPHGSPPAPGSRGHRRGWGDDDV